MNTRGPKVINAPQIARDPVAYNRGSLTPHPWACAALGVFIVLMAVASCVASGLK